MVVIRNRGIASCCFLLVTSLVHCRIVRRNAGAEVRNGRSVVIREENLSFNVNPGDICKVEVVGTEPMHQRVGILKPELFDCNYPPGSVRYEHNGSPFLHDDILKMRAYVLLSNHTMQETIYFRVNVLNSHCDVIQVNRLPLVVPRVRKRSNPVTRDVVDFDYDRRYDTVCFVRIPRGGFPRFGRMVMPGNSTSSEISEVEYIAVDNLKETCEDFVLMKLRYEHISPPTPDLDYIPLHVTVADRRSGSVLIEERHWLPIRINGAFPNQPPKSSFSNMYILEVDQFVLTNILPMTISAVDGETSSEKLIFNITRPPTQGFITHLQDQSKPIRSFLQQDLQNLQIAYQPPNISFADRQNFEVEFVVSDEYFAESEPMRVLFSVRVASTNAPRVSWNKGLTMLEGQSRIIDHNSVQVVDSDNLNQVRFTLAGGLRHGRLYVGERPGFSFGWGDILAGRVSYRHDDTDTRKDFIVFRVTDRSHSIRFKLPITILPKDDAPPFLINNIAFEVQEGQMILIHRFMLEASDADTPADYIIFNITSPPRAGEVHKRRRWERSGWRVSSFLQSDLYQGLIYYKHLGNEEFQDSFEFTMSDVNRPVPNVSPIQRVEIKVTPVDDLYPEPGPGNSLVLTVNETEVVVMTTAQLHYLDVEQADPDVTFAITRDLFRIDGSQEDAGKLIFTDDMVMLMKDPSVPTLRTFTQSAINHGKVAYMPPIRDIGTRPVDVQFVFSVTDDGGKQVTGKTFAITILPVDNQAPSIEVTSMCLNEGGTEILAADLLQVHDEDTDPSYLRIVLSQLPVAGTLRRDNFPLEEGDSFTLQEVENFRITYVHNGSEVHTDRFQLTVTDENQNSSATMRVNAEPVDDEQPVISGSNTSLHVSEGGSSAITSSFLSATDVDTDDANLIFEVLTPPVLGSITVDGENSIMFYQRDVNSGRVRYTHNGAEVGKAALHDLATVMVSDRRGQPISPSENSIATRDLHFTIVPVNSRAPRVAVGHRVFQCDEGDACVISNLNLMADDEDTPSDRLRYLVESGPTYGYVEDVTPQPGFESVNGVRTTSFTHEQLLSGHIRYKQSEHQGIEPTSDQYTIAVTDGQFKSVSVPFLISIIPANDEQPIISLENVTCNEGFMKVISLDVEDLDMPKDEVMITVTKSPNHGMIMNEMEMITRMRRSSGERQNHSSMLHAMHDMEPMVEFSLRELKENRVIPAYMNDGSEFGRDQFEMKFSDGRHVIKKLLSVEVMPVNDEEPHVAINNVISLEFGGTKVISGVALHATDDDTSASELIYELHSVPRRGNLQLQTDDSAWINLDVGDSFTETHVEMNRLRYAHTSVLGSKGKDSFRFSVSDGEFTSARENFQIVIENTKKKAIHVITHPLRVNEREKAFLSTDVISATDGSNQPYDIIFDVIREPIFGRIEYLAFPDVPIQMFTQIDLLARSVVYTHTSKQDSPVDTFRVSASNGLKSREAEVSVLIASVDAQLPTLIAGADNDSGNLLRLTLFRGSSVSLSQALIRIEDPDSPKNRLKLVLTTLPVHGTLAVNGSVIAEAETEISEIDLENSNFFYRHSGNDAEIDRFAFEVTDGVHRGYIYRGALKEEPTVFHLRIERLDDVPPLLRINRVPDTIQPLGNGRYYAIHLDHHLLEAEDEGSPDPGDVTFTLARPPLYGVIKLVSDPRTAVHRFTQSDLNRRNVMYVIAGRLNVTNDSFVFDVEDSWGNTLTGQRFFMSWARVEVMRRNVKVCEGTGSVPLGLRRFGNLAGSSFVGVRLKKGTATPGVDFETSLASQIQFDPHSASQLWVVNILNDNIEERKEKLKVYFHAPVNCVLVPRKTSSAVIILDRSHKACRRASSRVNTQIMERRNNRKRRPLNDSPRSRNAPARRYGNLPPGSTVPPQSFFRNRTVKVWRYHALSSISIDGGRSGPVERQHLPRENTERISRGDVSQNEPRLSDNPDVMQHVNQAFTSRLNVENTNTSALITVRGQNNERSNRPSRPAIGEQCVLSKTGSLFYDVANKVLYRCNGASWKPWRKPKRNSVRTTSTTTAACDRPWKEFGNKCYLIGVETGGSSWNSAQRACREEHSANLATIGGKKLLKWLWKFVERSRFWIGLNRKVNPRHWEWASGQASSSFMYWKRGSPSSTSAKDCVMVGSRMRWIDSLCNRRLSSVKYVCEKSP